jgi:hypothetical protein
MMTFGEIIAISDQWECMIIANLSIMVVANLIGTRNRSLNKYFKSYVWVTYLYFALRRWGASRVQFGGGFKPFWLAHHKKNKKKKLWNLIKIEGFRVYGLM